MAQPARLLFLFVATVALARPGSAQADPAVQPTPVLDNADLMDLMVKPAYDEVEKALAHPPHDRQAWAAIYQKAARREIHNKLLRAPRGSAGPSRRSSADCLAAGAPQIAAHAVTSGGPFGQ